MLILYIETCDKLNFPVRSKISKEIRFVVIIMYSKTCLHRIYLGPSFMFIIDRCWVYTGYFNKYFLN